MLNSYLQEDSNGRINKVNKMGVFFDSLFTDFFTLVIVLITTLFLYSKYVYQHWVRNNIAQLNPSFPFGDTRALLLKQESIGIAFEQLYKKFKKQNVPFGGYYLTLTPELLILDPDIIKQIMVKDFQHFIDRGTFSDEEIDPLSGHLFNLEGQKWKQLRAKLTPTFTSGKMRMMFSTLVGCSNELNNILKNSCSKSEPLDIKEILARFTTDVIGSCAFGIDCNCLKNENTDFRKYGQLSFEPEGLDKFKFTLAFLLPNFYKLFRIPSFNRNISKFFLGMVKDTVTYREENNVTRKDFIQLLIQLKNQGQVLSDIDAETIFNNATSKGLSIEEIAAQCFVFFLAGFETSATTMAFCLYELVKNPDIQEKVREEVISVLNKHNDELSYDGIMEMHYMEKVINETLRKYPPLSFLNRRCTKDFKLPKSNYIIRKGETVRISLLGLQRDPEYYPDPEKFDPERFSDEEKSKRHPFTFMPFGEGPRICIGLRFGMMQVKVGLSVLLKNYRFTLNKKTSDPVVMDPVNIILSTKGGIWLDAHKV